MENTDNTILTELPPADTVRWSPNRKARVVVAVESGALDHEEALKRYRLSHEEFRRWREALATHGVGGLRVTRLQLYRGPVS